MSRRFGVNQHEEVRKDYIIKSFTACLLPRIDHNGYLITRVVEENDSFAVRKSPLQIMQDSLFYYGSGLDDATKATKRTLGNINMAPVRVHNNIYWFPIYSKEREHNIWISANHGDLYQAKDRRKTNLYIGKRHIITLNLGQRAYGSKLHKARTLEKIHNQRFQEIDKQTPIEAEPQIIAEDQQFYYHHVQFGEKTNKEKTEKHKITLLSTNDGKQMYTLS